MYSRPPTVWNRPLRSHFRRIDNERFVAAGAVRAVALFPLVSRRFAGRIGQSLGRVRLVTVRLTPEYMLAYVALVLLGLSMLAVILALSIHNAGIAGYLMDSQADDLPYRVNAPRGLNLYAYEPLPRLYGQVPAYLLYHCEIILRESASLDMHGTATLGFPLDAAILDLRLVVAVVQIVAAALIPKAVDALSRALRRGLCIADLPTRLSQPLASSVRV